MSPEAKGAYFRAFVSRASSMHARAARGGSVKRGTADLRKFYQATGRISEREYRERYH